LYSDEIRSGSTSSYSARAGCACKGNSQSQQHRPSEGQHYHSGYPPTGAAAWPPTAARTPEAAAALGRVGQLPLTQGAEYKGAVMPACCAVLSQHAVLCGALGTCRAELSDAGAHTVTAAKVRSDLLTQGQACMLGHCARSAGCRTEASGRPVAAHAPSARTACACCVTVAGAPGARGGAGRQAPCPRHTP
jgi:hypothetical protein